MFMGGTSAVGVISPKHVEDSPNVPRPYVGCIVVPFAVFYERRSKLIGRVKEDWPSLRELEHNWQCQYLGNDGEDQREVTVVEPPRGKPVAFLSWSTFRALHDGAPIRIVETNVDSFD